MEIKAKISSFNYEPVLCPHSFSQQKTLKAALSKGVCIYKHPSNQEIAMSRWVSPKRTRSYPYTRVYDSFGADPSIKKVTVIPVVKDEGLKGDRDFLQYDTISLMSLVGVYVIVSYYKSAQKSSKIGKITNQEFDYEHVSRELDELSKYSGSVSSWNSSQASQYFNMATIALNRYRSLGQELSVEMHSHEGGIDKLHQMFNNPEGYIAASRRLASQAQQRELSTLHEDEMVQGEKASVTIENHVGGVYFLTADEWEIDDDKLLIVEAKNTNNHRLPGLHDVKDGLFKMMLFSNVDRAIVGDICLTPHAVLKLTSGLSYSSKDLQEKERKICDGLREEANLNGFSIRLPEQIAESN